MKMRLCVKFLLRGVVIAELSTSVFAQGTFGNLDFESATGLPVLNPPSATANVPTTNAFPSWVGYFGNEQTDQVLYNGASIGGTVISLITTNSHNASVIFGKYTASLAGG